MVEIEDLKRLVVKSLEEQGFVFQDDRVFPPSDLTKDKIRALHSIAVKHHIEKAKKRLYRYEEKLLQRIASGVEIRPERIMPRLIEVQPGSEDEILFRYVSLHWSIPVSSGYGRRLRFLVIDEQNGKLIGIFGLDDPVFDLSARDQWIGWNRETRKKGLYNVMDAFVLGAVPPYSSLLCGKLVAMLVASNEVRESFRSKYVGRRSIIQGKCLNDGLALITTTSALGRSSIYNRITYAGRHLYESVGFTQGSGEFHFSSDVYEVIWRYVTQNCKPTAKQEQWGNGFRNRREVVRKFLHSIGLPTSWIYHGIRRQVFVVPLAQNTHEFLKGEQSKLLEFDQPAGALFEWFKERWLLPRSKRDQSYIEFKSSDYKLWN